MGLGIFFKKNVKKNPKNAYTKMELGNRFCMKISEKIKKINIQRRGEKFFFV